MPQVGTQLDQYMALVEKTRKQAVDERTLAEQVKYETSQLIVQHKQLIPDLLRITLGFCANRRDHMRRPFVAWYDFALRCRVVPEVEGQTFILVPYQDFKTSERVVEQYACKARLRDALVTYIQALGMSKYENAMVEMLQSVGLGLHLSSDVVADDLRDYVAAHSMFEEANPAEYLEDITDED